MLLRTVAQKQVVVAHFKLVAGTIFYRSGGVGQKTQDGKY